MGTSSPLLGPSGGAWNKAARVGRSWARGRADEATFGEACREALATTLRNDPEAFGLRRSLEDAGERFVDVLGDVCRGGPSAVVDLGAVLPDERGDAFLAGFVEGVGGRGGLINDSVARRAARSIAEALLADPAFALAVRNADSTGWPLADEVFCWLYRWFFGSAVAEFLTTMITTKILLAAPVLTGLPFGASAAVAQWVAERVVAVVPSPCDDRTRADRRSGWPVELGRELVGEAVADALDIDTGTSTEGAGQP